MASHELKKFNASGGAITDTETRMTYNDGASTVDVVVHQLPGLMYWSQPSAGTMRKWVDELLKGKGVKRAGTRLETQPYGNAWRFTYYVRTK